MRWCPISVLPLLRCVRIWSCTRRGRGRLPLSIREILAYVRVLVKSLYFNSLTDSDVVFDSVFEPAFWTVEFVTRRFGQVCICLAEFTRYFFFFLLFIEILTSILCVLAGVCMSCGHIDQLYHRDSLFGPAASGAEHLHPCMDRLAPVFWTLDHHHDCFPLLQGCQDVTRISSLGRENNCTAFQIIPAWMKRILKQWCNKVCLFCIGEKHQPICIGLQKMHHAQTSKNTPLWYLQ